jgi:hypothetical protein
MTVLTRAQLAAALTARLPDNTAAAITPADLRAILGDLADSVRWGTDAPGLQGANGWQVAQVRDLSPPTHAYTLAAADEAILLRFTGGAEPFVVTLPSQAEADIRVGAVVHIMQASANEVRLQAGSGASLSIFYRALPETNGVGRVISVVKLAANDWRVFGEAEPSPAGMVLYEVLPVPQTGLVVSKYTQRRRVVFTAETACTVTLPSWVTDPLPVGWDCELVQAGTGVLSVSPEVGVTVRRRAGAALSLAGQHCRATLVKVAQDEWLLTGELGLS